MTDDEYRQELDSMAHAETNERKKAMLLVARGLWDENATLRQQLANATESMGRVEERCAKLRELVKAAWGCVNRRVSCDECRMVCCGCTLQSAMRELGIEVDE